MAESFRISKGVNNLPSIDRWHKNRSKTGARETRERERERERERRPLAKCVHTALVGRERERERESVSVSLSLSHGVLVLCLFLKIFPPSRPFPGGRKGVYRSFRERTFSGHTFRFQNEWAFRAWCLCALRPSKDPTISSVRSVRSTKASRDHRPSLKEKSARLLQKLTPAVCFIPTKVWLAGRRPLCALADGARDQNGTRARAVRTESGGRLSRVSLWSSRVKGRGRKVRDHIFERDYT